jgi:hypothetical protein
MSCTNCGNNSCCGDCKKSCIKIYKPTNWISGQTGVNGDDGDPGVGIVNVVDNGDGTFTIFLSDITNYTIVMPPFTGKHVVAINPVPGDDNEWELVYDDASTLIIPSAYYLLEIGTGVGLLDNQANHPTHIKSLEPKDNNAKILVEDATTDVHFNVKQYGRHTTIDFSDTSGLLSWMQTNTPRYQTLAGSTAPVTKSGGGSTMTNLITERYDINLQYIDAYKAILNFNILTRFDITYNDLSYQQAVNGEFLFVAAFTLPGDPNFNGVLMWDALNQDYFHHNTTVCSYDCYIDERDNVTNKHRRYAESKFCDAYLPESPAGSSDPGWIGDSLTGNKLVFRYPVIKGLTDPAGGADIIETVRFETIGSIIVNTNTNTDFMSTIAQIKNH